jgi:hypothetical protein
MPMDVVRLLDSDLFALSTGDEFKAALALWCKAWLQVPAASLPDDDRVLAIYPALECAGKSCVKWRSAAGSNAMTGVSIIRSSPKKRTTHGSAAANGRRNRTTRMNASSVGATM